GTAHPGPSASPASAFQPPVGPESFYPPSEKGLESDTDAMDIKPVHRFIPDSVKDFFKGSGRSNKSRSPFKSEKSGQSTKGVPCSPPPSAPPSPSLPGSYRDPYGGSGGSYMSQRDALLLGADAIDSVSTVPTRTSAQSVQTYAERVELYHQRYAYMKSWAGLLRILGCVQLLLGAAVFACVCAYVHKDSEWFNMYGYSSPQLYGGLGGGASGSLAAVCLKLWRHEAARMRREAYNLEVRAYCTPDLTDGHALGRPLMEPEILRGHIPAGHIPKPVVIADYVAKYPSIHSDEEREKYRAVFNDQYAEYKELHAEVQAAAARFDEMDEMMRSLQASAPSNHQEQERINGILLEYQRKKTDPTFLEKCDRCEYLKNKLAHIKKKISEYNQAMEH
uniref:MARVEL domain containing 2 n=2 Tax=Neogobius melanostomus TaxID=47308 RepID=A0A8C6U2Z3_9GOBI